MLKPEPKDRVTAADIQFIVLMVVAYALAAAAVIAVAAFLMTTAASTEPLPYAKRQGPCAPGYGQSGAYCAPRAGTTRQAVPRSPALGQQCPAGWRTSAAGCVEPIR